MIRALLFVLLIGAVLGAQSTQSKGKAPSKRSPAIAAPYRILIHGPLGGWTQASSLSFEAEVIATSESPSEEGKANLILQSWINGEYEERSVYLGQKQSYSVKPVGGENRVELRLEGRKVSAVRTFQGKGSVERLRIRLVPARSDEFWYRTAFGWLEVVEPDGAALTAGSTPSGGVGSWDWYTHARPPSGTWTLRWKYNLDESDPNQSSEENGSFPSDFGDSSMTTSENLDPEVPTSQDTSMGRGVYRGKVYVEVLLDPGTDHERRWVFDRLFLPGRAQITLGSFDVEF